jgi:hypothetical protein
MGKFLYVLYSLAVVGVMGSYSSSPSASGFWNANSYYHGAGAGSYGGSSGGGHK